jgi:hypothetical protein
MRPAVPAAGPKVVNLIVLSRCVERVNLLL